MMAGESREAGLRVDGSAKINSAAVKKDTAPTQKRGRCIGAASIVDRADQKRRSRGNGY
jgi:hypothetical protein